MIKNTLNKAFIAVFGVLLSVGVATAQTFNGSTTNTAGNTAIPSTGTGGCGVEPQTAATGGTRFNCAVAAPSGPLSTVQVNFTHTFTGDIDMYLVSPAGAIIELSTDNGGAGDNFTNTQFSDAAATSITAGTPPYTGTFRPEGTLIASTCGITVTPTVTTLVGMGATAGTWQLLILDDAGGDAGVMASWSLTFAPGCDFIPAQPLAAQTIPGINPAVCGVAGVPLTVPAIQASCAPGTLVAVSLNGVAQGNFAPGATWPLTAPVGVHVVRYQLPNGIFRTQTITVTDGVNPTVTCPANITLNLAPGECSTTYSYNVTCTDNCPFTLSGTVNHPIDFNNGQAGVMFDIQNISGFPINITNFTPSLDPGAWTIRVYVTTSATTWNGNQGNAAAWTLLGEGSVTSTGTNPGTVVPGYGLQLAPGQSRGIYITGTTGFPMNYTNASREFSDAVLRVNANPGAGVAYPFGTSFISRAYNGGVTYAYTAQGLAQTAGLPSGAEFPRGTTVNSFLCTDLSGNTGTCSFSVTVNEYPNAITSLICNDHVNISVDENCSATIGADQILEGGPYGCYDDYIVELDKSAPFGNGPWLPGVVGSSDIGKTYQVRVTDPTTGNKCWGTVKIEDKFAPVLVCPTVAVPCNFNTAPNYSESIVSTFRFGASGLPVSLPDNTTRTFTIPVSYDIAIADVDVRVRVSGDVWFGNITMNVTSPAGTNVNMWTGVGGCTGPIAVRFDDEGTTNLACASFTTDVNAAIPFGFGVLSSFDGQSSQGNWVVNIADIDAFGDQSTIEIVELYINGAAVVSTGFPNELVYNSNVFPNGNNSFVVTQGTGTPVMESCSNTTLSYIDSQVERNCASGFTATISRKWTAVDASGNTSVCTQTINLLRPTLSDVVLPSDYDGIDAPAFTCGISSYPSPDWIEGQGLQGYPYVFNQPVGCSINWEYDDQVLDVCDGTYKIRRDWTIIDWCTGTGFEATQLIKVLDEAGPAIECPANLTVSVDPFNCCATVDLPDAIIEDNCSRINNISAMVTTFDPQTGAQTGMYVVGGSLTTFPGNNLWDLDTLGRYGVTTCLPMGTHTVVYMAEDDCGNTSTCSFRLTVRDWIPPSVVATQATTVAVGVDDPSDCYGPAGPFNTPPALGSCEGAGVTWVKASAFDQGSTDNCGNLRFTARRMAPYSDCINALNQSNSSPACDDLFPDFISEFQIAVEERDSIKFYCCEVGTTQTILFRAYQVDLDGNFMPGQDGLPLFGEVMIQVEVQDKIKPVCIPPANVTVNCEAFDPSLWAYGKPTVADNCCLDTSRVYQGQCGLTHTASYTQFDTVCNRGTITRTFRAYDCHGFSSQCTQRVVVTYRQDYWVRFPNDVIVTVCDGSGTYGEPTFFGENCELLATSYTDELFTVVPDACFKIERTWKVINWCTYDPNQGCIAVPNPNPNAITNSPQNLPGPIVSPVGTPAPWAPTVVSITPGAPATNYGAAYWNANFANNNLNVNCYTYKQIIKVIDTQAPTAQCPASPVEFCDLTPNNGGLWNEMYYWDNRTESHDLCEGPSDLTLTATDACSGANINIEYLLFLDLDGNGSMETVVSSVNLPGFNRVNYNNAGNPNFSGGTAYAFDERPVPGNQKYGFAIQKVKSGNNLTANVRWNTAQSPTNYVIPELPYGTHKIKWFITDGCGNNRECEYTFVVKDCKKPTVVCLNGLSVNIMQTGMVSLWASDFLQYTEDNCTPTDKLKIGIVRSEQSTGSFPVDGNGNPLTEVQFTCADTDIEPELVQLWSIDLAGNADFCETYVLVQDNMGNCGGPKPTVAGYLKTEGQQGVEDAQVDLQGSSPAVPPFSMFQNTLETGKYEFSNAVPVASNLTITPVEDDNHINGVSTFDLVLISKHILGIEPLTSPYKMIAADANKSGSITTFDIVELRKLVLGVYTELPNNTSWRFVDKAYSFPNPSNPFAAVFPENKSIASLNGNMTAEDFVSVKVGDLNGNAVANSLMQSEDRAAGTLVFDVQDRAVKAGETFDVTFKAAEQVQGYQFTMNFAGLDVVDVTGLKAENYAVFAADKAMTTSVNGEGNEFTVRFRATQAGELSKLLGVSSRITKAEAYNAGSDRLDVAFRFNGANGSVVSGVGFELYQNVPNPFVSKTTIGFNLPEATTATLTIFDETGRMLWQQKGDFAKGYNQIAVDRALLNTTGMMYYQLETQTESATRKMIQTK